MRVVKVQLLAELAKVFRDVRDLLRAHDVSLALALGRRRRRREPTHGRIVPMRPYLELSASPMTFLCHAKCSSCDTAEMKTDSSAVAGVP